MPIPDDIRAALKELGESLLACGGREESCVPTALWQRRQDATRALDALAMRIAKGADPSKARKCRSCEGEGEIHVSCGKYKPCEICRCSGWEG